MRANVIFHKCSAGVGVLKGFENRLLKLLHVIGNESILF
jgi:hypothetical protein